MDESGLIIHDHVSRFVGLDDQTFQKEVEAFRQELCGQSPAPTRVGRAIDRTLILLAGDPAREKKLARLVRYNLPAIARGALLQLTGLLPPPVGRITCHLIPSPGDRGSGVCMTADELLAAAPPDGDVLSWVPFVIAHEYSHAVREADWEPSDTVREALMLEGLAMVLAETLFPLSATPYPWSPPSEEQESSFWARVDPDAEGDDARVEYLNNDLAYAIGAKIVREYLRRHGVSIATAHVLPLAQLYWESGYPFIR